jgi:flavin-dependent dehydrogenase
LKNTSHARSACGEGFFRIGDAFAFIDPGFSSGVLTAMMAAEIGAEVAMTWLDDPEAGLVSLPKIQFEPEFERLRELLSN